MKKDGQHCEHQAAAQPAIFILTGGQSERDDTISSSLSQAPSTSLPMGHVLILQQAGIEQEAICIAKQALKVGPGYKHWQHTPS